MEKFLKNFMKYYKKSRLFRFLYSLLIFIINFCMFYWIDTYKEFNSIKAPLQIGIWVLLFGPFFYFRETRKR
ncbi:hypothetical protein WG909_05385 [Peptostreptococcaceae bacterium AGR-M142]